jgi:hypothetical protein
MAEARLYRPAALLRFTLRFEDSSQVGDADTVSEIDPFPERSTQLDRSIDRLTTQVAAASADRAGGSPDGGTLASLKQQLRQITAARQRLRAGPPRAAAQTKEGGDESSVVVLVVPTDTSVENNGLTMANTASASFPWIDAPFYSYLTRGAGLDVLMGTIEPGQFATADAWVLPSTRAKLMFRGFVDSWKTHHDDGDATVSIEARSFESVLMDARINPLAKVYRPQKEEPISTYVNRILEQFPQTSGRFGGDAFRARWVGAAAEEPKLDRRLLIRSLQTAASRNQTLINQGSIGAGGQPVAPDDAETNADPAAALGVAGSPTMPPKAPGQEMSVWDLIVQACELAGCLPIYDPTLPVIPAIGAVAAIDPANTLLLRPAQTIFEDVTGGVRIPGGPIDQFARQFSSPSDPSRTVQSEVRFMIWGHNITSLETNRKLGKIRAPAVEVVSYNPDAPPAQRRLSARYPNVTKIPRGQKHARQTSRAGNPLRASAIGAKGEWQVDRVITKVVRGIRDLDQLQQIAVSLYHEIARQEVSVTIETDEMASYIDPLVLAGRTGATAVQSRVHNDDPDLLGLSAGTPCRVTVARQHRALSGAEQGALVLTPLSEVFERRSEELATFLRNQNARFRRTLNDEARIKHVTDRLAVSMATAKMLDVFYVRSVTHRFAADDGYRATIELVNYAPVRSDPKNLSPTDQLVNDRRKLVRLVQSLQDQIKRQVEQAAQRVDRLDQARHF